MNTQEVMQALGVSRNWINTHMRDIGERQNGWGVFVDYDYSKIIDWINDNAVATRQIAIVPYSHFGLISDEEASRRLDEIFKIDDFPKRGDALDEFDATFIPEDVRKRIRGSQTDRINAWMPVEFKIETLNQLKSMTEIKTFIDKNTEEMAYRHIYKNAMVKITLFGRTWYTKQEKPKDAPFIYLPAEVL